MQYGPTRDDTSTRRQALISALGGSIGGLAWPDTAARKRKKRKKKKCATCPDTCPARVACACSDGTCTYLPFNANPTEVAEACGSLCTETSGFQALISGLDFAASCTLFGDVAPVVCPLV